MWDVLVRTPQGSIHLRKLSLLLATMLMACFGYILAAAPTANAAPDATWDNGTILYDNQTYDSVSDTSKLPSGVASSPAIYQYVDSSKDPNTVHFIYFTSSEAQSEKEATYVRYTLNPPNSYSNKAGEKTISITPIPEEEQPATEDSGSSCTIDGIGWIVCPLMNGIAEGMDYVFEKVRGFLVVQPMTTDVNNPVYRIWQVSRDLANIAFVIGFMIIIYNYIVGGGMSGYEIRKIIPRLVIAAVLINISYVICAVAVDVSNIAGYGVNQLFEAVRDNTLTGSAGGDEISWTSVTTWVLAGGTGAIAGTAILTGSVAGAAGGLWFLLAPFLLGAALVIMVTFLILAARQAIIVLAIAIAPLAFAAYILPNTEKWFERWRGLFFTMLVMFPAFAAVFGGAQLAGELIIRMAAANGSIELIILGLGVMVAPLAITPLLLRLGGGVLNRIGGIINNKEKGLVDRYKNYNQERLADHVARNNARNAEMRANGTLGARPFRRYAARAHARNNYRSAQRKLNEESAENSWHNQHDRWGYNSHSGTPSMDDSLSRRNQAGRGSLDYYKRDNQLRHNLTEAQHEEHWQQTLDSDGTRRTMLTDTRLTEGRSKVISGAHEAQDERTLQTALNTDATYGGLRQMKVQTAVDSGIAQMNEKEITAHGSAALQRTVMGDSALKAMNVRTVRLEKEAAAIESTLKQRAEDNWERITANTSDPEFNGALRNIRFQEQEATQSLESSKKQWTELVENMNAMGASAPTITSQADKSIAGNLKRLTQDIALTDRAIEVAKSTQNENLAQALKDSKDAQTDPTKGDPSLLVRAGGIGGERAQTRIYAKAKSDVVNAAVEEVKTNRSLTSEMTRFQLHKLMRQAEMPDGSHATVEMQQAAMYALLQEKGNNQDAQEIRDAVAKMGLLVDDDGNYFEALRDGQGRIIPNQYGFAQIDRSKPVTDQAEIGRRRDWQQFFDDAAGGSPHSMVTYSGTNKSEARSGNLVDDIRGGFLRDATSGKFSPDKILKADIDELKTLLEDINSPAGYYAGLSSDKQRQVNDTLESAILRLQGNENINAGIDDRNRGAMNDILATINPAYAPRIVNGKRLYPVDENKAIVPPDQRTGAEKTFLAPVDVPGVHRPGAYYTDWNVDLQL